SNQMTCGEALMKLLEKYGVDTVFGMPGEHTLTLYQGIANSNIKHIQIRNEQGAGFMADGYARVSGKPGVCTLISGPGVTNAATAMGQAYADSIPMLIISSVTSTYTLGKGWGCLHEVTDQQAVTAPLTALSATALSPEDLPELIGQAYAIFESSRPRPVHISIPVDVLSMMTDGDWEPRKTPSRPMPNPTDIQAAVELLAQAKRPIICVGGGALKANEALTVLAEQLNASVLSSNAGKGVVPESHPLSLGGSIWRAPAQNYLAKADTILAIGTELSETDSFIERLDLNGKLIRVDIDPSKINDLYPADVGIVADAQATAEALLTTLQAQGISNVGVNTAQEVSAVREELMSEVNAVEAQHLKILVSLRQAMPADTVIMGDITQLVYTGSFAMPVDQPSCWHYPAGYCALGPGLPMAVGAKVAEPDRPVVVIAGDGGFMFTVQELATAAELGLNLPIILWENDGLGQIREGMDNRNIPHVGVTYRNPDFVAMAKAFGCYGVRPNSLAELEAAVTEAFKADMPTMINIYQDSEWLV
ncbi:MAG: 5-guanidino-2-oxopentanoate decarboxylase, partial [Chloroflexota bacterium]